jgi:hypothetical protein
MKPCLLIKRSILYGKRLQNVNLFLWLGASKRGEGFGNVSRQDYKSAKKRIKLGLLVFQRFLKFHIRNIFAFFAALRDKGFAPAKLDKNGEPSGIVEGAL